MRGTTPNYGADRAGLIAGFVFGPDGVGVPVDSGAAHAWLATGHERHPGEFAWLHFDLSTASSERWMREHLGAPESFFAALSEGTRSTRVELAENRLVAVVNDVLYDFAFGESHIATMWLCVSPELVISARRKPLRSIDRLRESVRRGDVFRDPVAILSHLLQAQVDVLAQIFRAATARVDQIEDSLLADRLQPQRANLGEVRRVLARLHRLLAPEPAALFRLLSRPPRWIGDPQAQDLREATEEFAVALHDMAALLDRVRVLQDEIAARITEQNSRSLFLLTVVTVLALPINIVAGLFGMNVGGIPLSEDGRGFGTIVGIAFAVTAAALWTVLRLRRD